MRWLVGILYVIIATMLTSPISAITQSLSVSDSILISEVQTTGASGAIDQEFVEIFNPTSEIVNLTNWKLQYSSSTGTSWISKVTLGGSLYPGSALLMASDNYLSEDSDFSFTAGFKMEAGHVRLTKPINNSGSVEVVDLLGWGTAAHPEHNAAEYAPAGSSMERKVDADNIYIDKDNNKEDFEIIPSPNPESTSIDPIIQTEQTANENETIPDPNNNNQSSSSDNTATESTDDQSDDSIAPQDISDHDNVSSANEIVTTSTNYNYPDIIISELLPNPGTPLTDEADEFIELYNPNNFAVSLSDFVIQTGNNYSYSYTLGPQIINPSSYVVLYSRDTNLVLANSSGKARILDPNGDTVFETEPYSDAKDNESWVYIDGKWAWSNQPTPGYINKPLLSIPVLNSVKKSTAKKKVATKKANAAKSTKKPTSTKKKAAAKKASSKKSDKNKALGVLGATNTGGGGSNLQPWIIAGIGALAVGYGMYEYKDDLANKLRQHKQNHRLRTKNRSAA